MISDTTISLEIFDLVRSYEYKISDTTISLQIFDLVRTYKYMISDTTISLEIFDLVRRSIWGLGRNREKSKSQY